MARVVEITEKEKEELRDVCTPKGGTPNFIVELKDGTTYGVFEDEKRATEAAYEITMQEDCGKDAKRVIKKLFNNLCHEYPKLEKEIIADILRELALKETEKFR